MNGERQMDSFGQDFAFKSIDTAEGYLPAISVGPGQRVKLNFGHDVNSLKFFTCNAMHEGYQPFAVYMTRNITLWFTNTVPSFVNQRDLPNPSVKVLPSLAGNESWPILSVQALSYSSSLPHQALPHPNSGYTVLRLALPIVCNFSSAPPQVQFLEDLPRRKTRLVSEKRGDETSPPQQQPSVVRRRSAVGAPDVGSPRGAQQTASGAGARIAPELATTAKGNSARNKSPFAFFRRLVSEASGSRGTLENFALCR